MKRQSWEERQLDELGLLPTLSHELPELFNWLAKNGLTRQAHRMDSSDEELAASIGIKSEQLAIAQSTHRQPAIRHTQKELKELREKWQNEGKQGIQQERLWQAQQDTDSVVRALQWERLPADAMAFYRPFHYPPFDQWGIYLLVEPLLQYHDRLLSLNKQLGLFSPEVLMHLVLFEVFNHEFFHHLVESTATTLEILEAAQGRNRPIFLEYKQRQYQQGGFDHPHRPLEEALANAYAYNALSFISRIKAGFKTTQVKVYQQAIHQHWKLEPPGYRDAGLYVNGNYLSGGAHLLAQILGDPGVEHTAPLSCVVKHVMPTGFSAFAAKPNIPVWLVGDQWALNVFEQLVPAPLEAYTQLFWPYDMQDFDTFIQRKQEEVRKKKAAAG